MDSALPRGDNGGVRCTAGEPRPGAVRQRSPHLPRVGSTWAKNRPIRVAKIGTQLTNLIQSANATCSNDKTMAETPSIPNQRRPDRLAGVAGLPRGRVRCGPAIAMANVLRALRKGATFAARGGQFSGWAMGRGMQPLAAGADRG